MKKILIFSFIVVSWICRSYAQEVIADPQSEPAPAKQAELEKKQKTHAKIDFQTRYLFSSAFGNSDLNFFRQIGSIKAAVPPIGKFLPIIGFQFDYANYDWSNYAALSSVSTTPVENAYMYRIQPGIVYLSTSDWEGSINGFFNAAKIAGASFENGRTYGGILTVSKKFSPKFSLTGYLVVLTRLGRSTLILPVPGFEWHISDRWMALSSARITGPYSQLSYRMFSKFYAFVEAKYELIEYRVQDAVAGSGVFQDKGLPVTAGMIWKPYGKTYFDIGAGTPFIHKIHYSLDNGTEVFNEKGSIAPIVFLNGHIEF